MVKIRKAVSAALLVLAAGFILSVIVYFFNLDNRLIAKAYPLLEKYYDRRKDNE